MTPYFFFFSGFGGGAAPTAGRPTKKGKRYFVEIEGYRLYGKRDELAALIASRRKQELPALAIKTEGPGKVIEAVPLAEIERAPKRVAPDRLRNLVDEFAALTARAERERAEWRARMDDEDEAVTLLLH